MKNLSNKMKKYLFDSKVATLSSIMSVIRHDIKALLSDYMGVIDEPTLIADIDDKSGRVVLTITASADEVYEAGRLIR